MQNPTGQDPQTQPNSEAGDNNVQQPPVEQKKVEQPVNEVPKEPVVAKQAPVTSQETVAVEQAPTQETAQQAAPTAQEETTKEESGAAQAADKVQEMGKEGMQKVGAAVGNVLSPKGPDSSQPQVKQDEKTYAAIGYVPFVALVSIIIKPDSAYVRMHAKQALLLAIMFFLVGILAAIVSLFGIIGQLLAVVLGLVPLACIIIGVYSMYLAYMGFWWKIPVLSTVANIIPVEMMAKVSKENITGQAGVAKEDYDERQAALDKEKKEAAAPEPTVKKEELAAAAPNQENAKPAEVSSNNEAQPPAQDNNPPKEN